jgi:hypothetical protein
VSTRHVFVLGTAGAGVRGALTHDSLSTRHVFVLGTAGAGVRGALTRNLVPPCKRHGRRPGGRLGAGGPRPAVSGWRIGTSAPVKLAR